MTKHFFLFRHGETTYNVNGFVQGQTNNSVLTEKGHIQAYQVGQILKNHPIDVLISSPLKRAIQTAQEVLKSMPNVPFVTDERLTEVNVGEIEGLHYTKVQEKFGEKYKKWHSLDEQYLDLHFECGESKRDVRLRVFEALNEYANNPSYTYIAVSGHGILLSQTLLALNQSVSEIKNGCIIHLIHQNNQWHYAETIV